MPLLSPTLATPRPPHTRPLARHVASITTQNCRRGCPCTNKTKADSPRPTVRLTAVLTTRHRRTAKNVAFRPLMAPPRPWHEAGGCCRGTAQCRPLGGTIGGTAGAPQALPPRCYHHNTAAARASGAAEQQQTAAEWPSPHTSRCPVRECDSPLVLAPPQPRSLHVQGLRGFCPVGAGGTPYETARGPVPLRQSGRVHHI